MIEAATPLLFRRRELIADSGGAGRFRGGLGVVTEVEVCGKSERACVVSVMTDRVDHPPLGFGGGKAGAPNRITRDGERIPSKSRSPVRPGQLLKIETAGGAGFGPPEERDPAAVDRDRESGYVSEQGAVEVRGGC
jgi:N-methylhydantoinase B